MEKIHLYMNGPSAAALKLAAKHLQFPQSRVFAEAMGRFANERKKGEIERAERARELITMQGKLFKLAGETSKIPEAELDAEAKAADADAKFWNKIVKLIEAGYGELAKQPVE